MASTDDMAATVRRYVELVGSGNAQAIADLYAADAHVEDPVGSDPRIGRDAIVEFYQAIENLDRRTELKWVRAVGDTAVFEFTLSSGGDGTGFEITPIDIMEFNDDGSVKAMRAVWSQEHFKQL